MTQAKSDAEDLLNAMLPVARETLEAQGAFHPYAGAMTPDGEVVSISAVAEDVDDRTPTEIIQALKAGFRRSAQRSEFRATGIFYDVRVIPPGAEEKTDAIAAALDHVDGYSVIVVLPYRLVAANLEFGETFAQRGDGDIFVQ